MVSRVGSFAGFIFPEHAYLFVHGILLGIRESSIKLAWLDHMLAWVR